QCGDQLQLTHRDPARLAMPVDDPRAVEVVRGQLDPHAVTGQDADPKPPHLARDVPEHHVVVVELDAEHRVRQGLDDLALELDLFFLCHDLSVAEGPVAARLVDAYCPVPPVPPCDFTFGAFCGGDSSRFGVL